MNVYAISNIFYKYVIIITLRFQIFNSNRNKYFEIYFDEYFNLTLK